MRIRGDRALQRPRHRGGTCFTLPRGPYRSSARQSRFSSLAETPPEAGWFGLVVHPGPPRRARTCASAPPGKRWCRAGTSTRRKAALRLFSPGRAGGSPKPMRAKVILEHEKGPGVLRKKASPRDGIPGLSGSYMASRSELGDRRRRRWELYEVTTPPREFVFEFGAKVYAAPSSCPDPIGTGRPRRRGVSSVTP